MWNKIQAIWNTRNSLCGTLGDTENRWSDFLQNKKGWGIKSSSWDCWLGKIHYIYCKISWGRGNYDDFTQESQTESQNIRLFFRWVTFLNASGFKKKKGGGQAFICLTMVNDVLKQYKRGQHRRCHLLNDENRYKLLKWKMVNC